MRYISFCNTYLQKCLYAAAILSLFLIAVPEVRIFFQDSGYRWLYMLLLSFLLSYTLTPLCGKLAFRFRILDLPDARKTHGKATPLLGGMAVFAAFAIAILGNGLYSPKVSALLGAALLLFLMGLADDVKEIPAGIKLLIQMGAVLLVMSFGIVLRVLPENPGIFSAAGNMLLTVFWIIGISNAMNFFDGMDGLAAGTGAIISFFIGITAVGMNRPFPGWIAVAMMGACLGFLPHNFRIRGNARIFLGDAGSTVIGFVLACLAVYGDWAQDNYLLSLLSPILIFWILIFDMIHITAERILTGKVGNFRQWIEYVGKDHLHHRLADLLGSRKKSVLFIYMMTVFLGMNAVLLRNADSVEASLLIVQALFLVLFITVLERRGRTLADDCREKRPQTNHPDSLQ